jgi:hypothetical protein
MAKATRIEHITDQQLGPAFEFINSLSLGTRREIIQNALITAKAQVKELINMLVTTHAILELHPENNDARTQLFQRMQMHQNYTNDIMAFEGYLDSLKDNQYENQPQIEPKEERDNVVAFPKN